MAQFRVKAFFMHEDEQQAAKNAEKASVMTDTEWTEGYLMGVIEEREISALVGQGLVITPIERVETKADASRIAVRSLRPLKRVGERAPAKRPDFWQARKDRSRWAAQSPARISQRKSYLPFKGVRSSMWCA